MSNRVLCVGMLAAAHGVRGLMKLHSFTEDPEAIFDYAPLSNEDGAREFVIEPQHVAKGTFVVSVEGVTTKEEADALRGTKLFVARDALPKPKKREYYEADLKGLIVTDDAGKNYGTIIALHDYGAGPFLEIGLNRKASFMLPFTDSCVPMIDLKGGHVSIAPPAGWLDEEKEPTGQKPSKKQPGVKGGGKNA